MSDPIVLRPRKLVAFCWFAFVGTLVASVALAIMAVARDPGPAAVLLLLGTAVSLGFLRATRMRVVLEDGGLRVFRLIGSEFVQWSDLIDVSVAYGGLRLKRADGAVVTAASMGKPNWAKWFHRRVAPDDWVEIILNEMSKAHSRCK